MGGVVGWECLYVSGSVGGGGLLVLLAITQVDMAIVTMTTENAYYECSRNSSDSWILL